MKKQVFLILLLLSVLIIGCKNDNSSLLLNKWNLIAFSEEINEIIFDKNDILIWEFLPDNVLTITNIKKWGTRTDTVSVLNGSWEIFNGNELKLMVKELESETIWLISDIDEKDLYLTKINDPDTLYQHFVAMK